VVTIRRPIVQIAYIVPDVRAAAQQWVDRVGAGPFFVFDHFELTASHRGEAAVLDHSPAFGQWGDVQVELIQLHELEPAPFREAFGGGKIGLHHMTWFPDDLDAEGARLEELGWPCVLDMTGHTGTRALFPRRAARARPLYRALRGHPADPAPLRVRCSRGTRLGRLQSDQGIPRARGRVSRIPIRERPALPID